ncbi:hypothetical protein HNQ02_003861 [Flavobacterium sp. 7E]|uniref:hypothetical protein n=1 Tax=Flavobacterium sp. 7E TaxID=2735898 RepID=UPI0015708A33|nr:hypothetical protein [Flavobacterium sp. 7E]NRS90910.1 hypothetical protein [Flavobacterium sp. 7E]
MSLDNKKISPQAILALKEALSVIFWKKEELQDFTKLSIENSAIIGTINWNATKRESVKELIERMINRQDLYKTDLMNLITSVSDMNDFSHLKFWDEDGTKTKKAEEAVEKLRNLTKGYFQITKEQEDAKKRKIETEKQINKNKSLESELNILKTSFMQIASGTNNQKRGFELEKFLYDLFLLYDLSPKGSFKNYGEQIDGAFTFDGTDYLMEAKWSKNVDRGELATFCYKVETKFKTAVGLLITIDGLTKEAISPHFKSIIIMDGSDLMVILEGRVTLPDLLLKKRRKAIETGNIYVNYQNL